MLPTTRSRIPSALLHRLHWARYIILVVGALIIGGCGYSASKFPGDCSQDSAPPPDSASAAAKKLFASSFPQVADVTGFIVYAKNINSDNGRRGATPAPTGEIIDMALDERFNHFDFHLEYYAKTGNVLSAEYIKTHPGDLFYYGVGQYNATVPVASYSSYRAVSWAKLPLLVARTYITPGNTSVAVVISLNLDYKSQQTIDFAVGLSDTVPTLLGLHGLATTVEAYTISLPNFLEEVSESVNVDLRRMFLVIIPLALCAFGLSLSSGRIVLLPLCVFAVSLVFSCAILDGVAHTMEVNSMSPGIAVMITIALTLDYTYFMASQWRREMIREIEAGAEEGDDVDPVETLRCLYHSAGKPIIVSSQVIALCGVGVVAFNVDLIRSIGITIVVSAEITGMMALLVPPALLTAFPCFFFAALDRWCDALRPEDCVTSPYAVETLGIARTSNVIDVVAASNRNTISAQQHTRTSESSSLLGANGNGKRAPTDGYSDTQSSMLSVGGSDAVGEEHAAAQSLAVPAGELKARKTVSYASSGANGSMAADGAAYHHLAAGPSGSRISITSRRVSVVEANKRASALILRRAAHTAQKHMSSQWRVFFLIADFITGIPHRFLFIVAALAFISMTFPYALTPNYSNSIYEFVPRTSPSLPGWNALQFDFRAGMLFSYNLVMEFPPEDTLFTEPYFTKQSYIAQRMINDLPQTSARNIDALGFSGALGGFNVTFYTLLACYSMPEVNRTSDCNYLLITAAIFVSPVPNTNVGSMMIQLDFDPTSSGIGSEWYTKARTLLVELERDTGLKLSLRGYAAETFDTISYAQNALKVIVLAGVGIVALVIFLAFGSITIAIVVLGSVCLTVGAVFGLMTLVYTHQFVNDLGFSGLQGSGSIAWQVPFSAYIMAAGIALNYEIIFVAKVFELRWKGLDTHHSIVAATASTGKETTVGALMMVITFCALLLSEVPAMNELGFTFAAAAIIDAFFVRWAFTPAILAVLRHWSWFPLQYCPSAFTPPVVSRADANEFALFDEDEEEPLKLDGAPGMERGPAESEAPAATGARQSAGVRHTRESHTGLRASYATQQLAAGGHPAPTRPAFSKAEEDERESVVRRYRGSSLAPAEAAAAAAEAAEAGYGGVTGPLGAGYSDRGSHRYNAPSPGMSSEQPMREDEHPDAHDQTNLHDSVVSASRYSSRQSGRQSGRQSARSSRASGLLARPQHEADPYLERFS